MASLTRRMNLLLGLALFALACAIGIAWQSNVAYADEPETPAEPFEAALKSTAVEERAETEEAAEGQEGNPSLEETGETGEGAPSSEGVDETSEERLETASTTEEAASPKPSQTQPGLEKASGQETASPEGAIVLETAEARPAAKVAVVAHVQNKGWMPAKALGESPILVGTTGQALRMEALRFTVSGIGGTVQCQAHVQNIGWQAIVAAGRDAGTTGRSLRVEAIRIALTGELSQWYDISYRAHVQNKGWMDWVSDSQIAGTSGQSLRMEALEIKLTPKAAKAAQPSDGIVGVRASSHVQNIGWQNQVSTGAVTGTTGRGLRMEALQLALDAGTIGGGIQMKAHVQNIGWQSFTAGTAGTTGRGLRMEALQIHLTGAIANSYDVVYRAHVQNIGWQPWTLDDGIAGTTGRGLAMEALQIKLIKKGSSQDIAEGAYFIAASLNPQEVLNVTGNSEAANTRMQVNSYNTGSFAERFYIRKSNGAVTIQAATSGLFLTDSGSSTIVQSSQNNADSQRWSFSWNAGYQLKNVATGKAMSLASTAANGVWVNAATANASSPLQRWTLTDTGIVPDGSYTFTNTNSGRVLDVSGANRRDGANVQIHQSNNGNNQKFTVTYLGSNQYSVRNTVTTRAVQVSGMNVQMQGWTGANAQKWKLDLVGAKTFRLINVGTGTALDVANHATANGSNVVVASGTANSQRFKLASTSRIAETVNLGVPAIMQNPELPTGCESVALTEALNYYGFNLGKTVIADRYMTRSGDDFVYSFMGNPHSSLGASIMAPGLTNAANRYLTQTGSSLRATNITGTGYGDLYAYLDQGIPVVVWNTMYMHDPGPAQASKDGYTMHSWSHAVTLSGYNPFNNTVLVADPLSGNVWRDRGRFEWLYNEMGRQAVIVK